MTTTAETHTTEHVEVMGARVEFLKNGTGDPVFVFHHSIGSSGWMPFHGMLAAEFETYLPDLPGWGKSERPLWMRSVHDLAHTLNVMLEQLNLDSVSLVGLGIGGWLAAEMATVDPRRIKKMVLVGAPGIQPEEGEILDQMLIAFDEYVLVGFHDESKFDEIFTPNPSDETRALWDYSREMTARIAWKPWMFSRSLPPLLTAVRVPTLLVWGSHDRVVPVSTGQLYERALQNARLEIVQDCGHLVDMEQPQRLAELVTEHLRG